jgi:hypothetical protein
MNPDDADAYDIEIGKHVTGAAIIANQGGHNFLRQPITVCRYMPQSTVVLYTPLKNLVMGINTVIRRDSQWHARRRVLEFTYDMAIDFEIAVKKAVVLAKLAN